MGIDKESFSWAGLTASSWRRISCPRIGVPWSTECSLIITNGRSISLIEKLACAGVNISWPPLDLYLDCNWKVVHEENQHFMIRCLIIIISVHLLCITNTPRSQPKKRFNKIQLELAVCMPKGTSFAQRVGGALGAFGLCLLQSRFKVSGKATIHLLPLIL